VQIAGTIKSPIFGLALPVGESSNLLNIFAEDIKLLADKDLGIEKIKDLFSLGPSSG